MDSEAIVKGLINEYIKPPHPIYHVDYVKVSQEYDCQSEEMEIEYESINGLFYMIPKCEYEITNPNPYVDGSLNNIIECHIEPISSKTIGSISQYRWSCVSSDIPKKCKEQILKKYSDYSPYVEETIVEEFNSGCGDNVHYLSPKGYIIIRNIKRVG